MDILNFISWIKGGRVVTTVDPAKTLLPVGLKDNKRDDGYLAGAISVQDFLDLVPIPVDDNLASLITFSASEIVPGFPGDPITNLVKLKDNAFIVPTNVYSVYDSGPMGFSKGYGITITTTLPNAELYDWAIEMANVAAIPFYALLSRTGVNYQGQNLLGGILCDVLVYSTASSMPSGWTIDNITLRVTAKLKP